jgi:hypothetical protein
MLPALLFSGSAAARGKSASTLHFTAARIIFQPRMPLVGLE